MHNKYVLNITIIKKTSVNRGTIIKYRYAKVLKNRVLIFQTVAYGLGGVSYDANMPFSGRWQPAAYMLNAFLAASGAIAFNHAGARSHPIDRIFASELRRTQQTAELVNQFHHVNIEVNPLLNDHRSGYEGKSAELLMEAMNAAENKWTARFNNGESIEDMKKRVAEFLDTLKTKPYDVVLVVTSGWVIRVAVAIVENISTEEAWSIDAEQGSFLEFEI